jgi:transcriptional regulator with XRE-family HTH domain
MEKTKLIEMRNLKRLSQQHIAEQLNMDVSCYNRREKGEVYIKIEEWEKLAKILNVPISEIFETDEKQSFICKDKSSSNFFGTNNGTSNIYTIPEALFDTMQKYITKLEEEIKELKWLLEKK